jgi:hypothetical protein
VSELSYVYRHLLPGLDFVTPGAVEAFNALSPIIMDHWISFASSLSLNDGKGIQREFVFCMYMCFGLSVINFSLL